MCKLSPPSYNLPNISLLASAGHAHPERGYSWGCYTGGMRFLTQLRHRTWRWRHRESLAHHKGFEEGRAFALKMIEKGYHPETNPVGYATMEAFKASATRLVDAGVLNQIGREMIAVRAEDSTEADGNLRRAAQRVKRDAQEAGTWPHDSMPSAQDSSHTL